MVGKKVDGGGVCELSDTSRHLWLHACIYQVNADPSPIAGAPPGPVKAFARFYCQYCLDPRDLELPTPIFAGVVVQNLIVAAQPQPAPLLH